MKTIVTTCVACLLLFASVGSVALAGPNDGRVLGATKLVDHGTDAQRFDLVIVAEGYEAWELPRFRQEALVLANQLLATAPFGEMQDALNVWRIDVESSQSGADDPMACAGSAILPFTYFDASFCAGGQYRRLVSANFSLVTNTVDDFVPAWDQIVVLVNFPLQGGFSGPVMVLATGWDWERTFLHLFGHSFGLTDEYDFFGGCAVDAGRNQHPLVEPVAPNVTVENVADRISWGDLIAGSTPVPTTSSANCGACDPQGDPRPGETVVGVYEGAHYFHCGAYRPAFHCMMRDLGPFCPVCQRRIRQTLAAFRDTVDPPNGPPVCDAGGPYHEECAGTSTAVLLDGSGSSDPDGDPLSYEWSGAFPGSPVSGSGPTVAFPLGSASVTLEVHDGLEGSTCTAPAVVEDTLSPTLVAPADVRLTCAAPGQVELGSPSVADRCDAAVQVTNDAPSTFPSGETLVTWRARDASGNEATDTQLVTVTGGGLPVMGLSVFPEELWPPEHQMVPVTVTVDVADPCDPQPRVRLVSVTSNEPDEDPGSGSTSGDIQGAELGTDDREMLLRAERTGGRVGRIYTLVYEVTSSTGLATMRSVLVRVPDTGSVRTEAGRKSPPGRGR